MGANKAKDLGVRYTDSDLQTGRALTGVSLEDQSASDKSLSFSGQKDISGNYTSQIITAMVSSAKYKYYPLSNTQVRINDDGSVEASGNFNIDKALKWSEDLGGGNISDQAKTYTKFISNNPSFYLKGKLSIVDNKINLNISEAQISRFSATASMIDQYQGQLASFVEDRIAAVPGMKVKAANFENGQLKLDATYPAVEKSLK
jgi:hypothetical protein